MSLKRPAQHQASPLPESPRAAEKKVKLTRTHHREQSKVHNHCGQVAGGVFARMCVVCWFGQVIEAALRDTHSLVLFASWPKRFRCATTRMQAFAHTHYHFELGCWVSTCTVALHV